MTVAIKTSDSGHGMNVAPIANRICFAQIANVSNGYFTDALEWCSKKDLLCI